MYFSVTKSLHNVGYQTLDTYRVYFSVQNEVAGGVEYKKVNGERRAFDKNCQE